MGNYKLTKSGYIVVIIVVLVVISSLYFIIKPKISNENNETSKVTDNKVEELKSDIKKEELDSLNQSIELQKEVIKSLEEQINQKNEKMKQMEDVIRQSSCSIYFRSNSTELEELSKKSILIFIQKSLFLEDSTKIVLAGNVYAQKNNENQNYGLSFSIERANSVALYLEEMGIDETRLKIIGNGGSNPHYYNDTHKSMELSRRVDIYFE